MSIAATRRTRTPKDYELNGGGPNTRRAYRLLKSYFVSEGLTDSGGCKTFYTPREWRDRGEVDGREAILIVVHDGGDVSPLFNWSYEAYPDLRRTERYLAKHGLCAFNYGWFTAIDLASNYPSGRP